MEVCEKSESAFQIHEGYSVHKQRTVYEEHFGEDMLIPHAKLATPVYVQNCDEEKMTMTRVGDHAAG